MESMTKKLVKYGKKGNWCLPVALLGIVLLYLFSCVADNLQLIWRKLYVGSARRLVALTLSMCMVLTLFPSTVFATEGSNITFGASNGMKGTIGCESHTEHDDDCNYIEAKKAKSCGHLQEDGSYSCAPAGESEDDNPASPSEAKYACDHDDDCGYAVAVVGADCTHECELCKVVDKPDCTCPIIDSGVIHDDSCTLNEIPPPEYYG